MFFQDGLNLTLQNCILKMRECIRRKGHNSGIIEKQKVYSGVLNDSRAVKGVRLRCQ